MTTVRMSREELQAIFMQMSVTEVRELHDRIAAYGGAHIYRSDEGINPKWRN
jgi:hypothetical protein